MAEPQSHDPNARDEAYLLAFDGILRAQFGRRPFRAAANAIAQLQREQEPAVDKAPMKILRRSKTGIPGLVDWLIGRLMPRHNWLLPLSAAGCLLIVCASLFLYWHGRTAKGAEVGKFTDVTGAPALRHAGQRSTFLSRRSQAKAERALRSTPVRLGDRIETGDADKAEIQFNDGSTLRLSFNTTLEIPKAPLQRFNTSTPQRPPAIKLLAGQVWAKVQELTNAPQFAVQTPVATAAVKGTEFGLKLQKATATKLKTQNSKLKTLLTAILTVREGTVEFSNAFGKVDATALTESQATADSAPTQPQRVAALKTFRLNRTHLSVSNRKLFLQAEPEWMIYPVGWIGVTMVNATAGAPAGLQAPTDVRISGVRPASPAALAGLQVGDVIGVVNGQALTNRSQVREAIVTSFNRPLTLSLQRAGGQLTVTVIPTHSPNAQPLPAIPLQVQNALFDATAQLIAAGFQRQIAPGQVTEGEIALQRLLRSYPDVAALHHNLAVLFESKDELGEAIHHYQRAVELDPFAALYHLHLGLALRSIGNLERSVEELEQAVSRAPASPLTSYWLADAYSVVERHEDAVNALDAGLRLNPQDPTLWQQKAEVLLRARQTQAALPAALKAVELDPANAPGHGTLGLVYYDLGRNEEAEAAQRKAIELGPPNAAPYINLAHLLRQRGQLDEAQALYRKALELEPESASALNGLGGVFFERRQAAEAEKWFRKAVEADPNSPTFIGDLGNILRVLDQLDQGEQLLRKALELEPENGVTYFNLGLLYFQRKQWPEAEQLLLKAHELDANLAIESTLAPVYHNEGKLDQEEQALRRSLARNTNNPAACNELAWHLAERGIKLDEALDLAQRTVDLATNQPYLPNVLDTLGWVYYHRGELDQAEQIFQRAIDMASTASSANSAREHLKKVHEKRANPK